jgi:hypothetical protein
VRARSGTRHGGSALCNAWSYARLVLDVLGIAMIGCLVMAYYVWRVPWNEERYRRRWMSDLTD